MTSSKRYRIFPLGDTAMTICYGDKIDEVINEEVLLRVDWIKKQQLPGILDVIPAYSSLTIYYDIISLRKQVPVGMRVYDWLVEKFTTLLDEMIDPANSESRQITIPVCYDETFAPDLKEMASTIGMSTEEVIGLHSSQTYRVYMLGFLPGFTYMGQVDERIRMPRKSQPQMVVSGSVGIAGRQTGIYPLASPGGWQIIGRTPIKLFDAQSPEPVKLKAGDQVRFTSISINEFANY